jgi:hypothetical protein
MEVYSDSEIAAQVDRGLRTVGRELALIREAWLHEEAS